VNPLLLRPVDVRLIHLVVCKRRGEPAPALDEQPLEAMLSQLGGPDGSAQTHPFRAAAALAAGVLRLLDGGLGRQVALLAICCQLRLAGYQLTAPQGVLAGMIDGMDRGRVSVADLTRWIEDRALLVFPG
jgi:hypothetical protein